MRYGSIDSVEWYKTNFTIRYKFINIILEAIIY